ncbi:hypothetical protein OBO34_21265 [Clostridiales Family XIII bacterium ASD5510]|uniref:Uncharacterized protein n=1 Tax=Hominibacterium faecale TaxID=2839743 RepID=A0A9J6QZF3_9FIRM|nr:hypothetical protein [Hominibacterium faecale]MCU7380847.1 hypothetical protein [Hominibacterium faecale]
MARTVGMTVKKQAVKQTKADIIEELEANGIEYDKQMKLEELKALMEGAQVHIKK